ncbi:MAG: cyanophycin synthetase [Candidatus Margulisbacteria bacterium]|nr:cyanophycin synthetase [Candidatus Margulisiibacteriota bacterium]
MQPIPPNLHFNFQLLLRELQERNIQLSYIPDTDIVEARFDKHIELLVNCDSRLVPSQYINLFGDKYFTNVFLKEKKFPVPESRIFESDRQDLALYYAQNTLKFPVVVKPNISEGGYHVYCNIESREDFIICFEEIRKNNLPVILVEKYLRDQDDYRFFVTSSGYTAVIKRTCPRITGDGKLSIIDLIEKENYKRLNPRNTCLCDIYIKDIEAVRALSKQKHKISDVLADGEELVLRFNSNVGSGGWCEDVTDEIHPSYISVAHDILRLFPDLGFTGIDLLIKDPGAQAVASNYSVLEINHRPGFSLHTLPGNGQSRNVLKPVVDLLFPETVT